MRIDVLWFGILRAALGSARESVELDDDACVSDLLASARSRGAVSEAIWATVAVAVNREYSAMTTQLRDGDEVAFLPPVSGGSR